ncbi:2-C-methyl-D-erythritol 4-phosphate cytidylyltransferase [Hamadaea tsunoensis]|uniref:2-C-methyl-D-erythritol 4-phosphate cytidylyltransferase n=1 Tax=Hamadaea tsunoensis TaxID=53368 RepID=UPI000427F2BF|nr:2-C-methyl-D-erythritol 4-phosphate cytidylyltransferase [Hamadaea tsunoensis]
MNRKIVNRDIATFRGDVAVLVPAAGSGLRLGGGVPKALRELDGRSLLSHAISRLTAAPSVGLIVVAAPPHLVAETAQMITAETAADAGTAAGAEVEIVVVAGGATRQESVALALAAVPEGLDIILVHDAARALTPSGLVESVAAAVREGHGAVIPALAVVDTVKRVSAADAVLGTVDRSELRAVQTPQGFRRSILVKAHADAVDQHTDDAGMVERLGLAVHCVPGSEYALKITRPIDLILAEALLRAETA